MTTLTRQQFLDSAKPVVEKVHISGIGDVLIRSVPEVQRSRRIANQIDESGKFRVSPLHRVHKLIDQLMLDECTPMFRESDADALSQLGGEKLDPYIEAINEFNERHEGNEQTGSNGSPKN